MKTPAVLAFNRSINPGHFLMFSAPTVGAPKGDLSPIAIREEPLRGLNATAKTKEEEKSKAVLQVVESAELAAGHPVLSLIGKVLVRAGLAEPHSCNEREYGPLHQRLVAAAKAGGDFTELARRYALTIALGGWAWRNALEAESLTVFVDWTAAGQAQSLQFTDLLPAQGAMFNYDAPEYEEHKASLEVLAQAIEAALTDDGVRGVNFTVRADVLMGQGARVYPSQEWASAEAQRKSKERWPGGEGVTRMLAKIKTPDGQAQAIINDRKVGNALRVIDTWYPDAKQDTPIAVEPYGANSHQGVALRTKSTDSMFGIIGQLAEGKKPITPEQRMFYLAACIRGGVFAGEGKGE